jgi:hypothetical protein
MIQLDVWLYGPLAKYAGDRSQGSHGHLAIELPEGSTMRDLLTLIGLPPAEKAMTFVNGSLTDTPGLLADLDRVLVDGDRVAFFHRKSMWPFQYRFGAATGAELKDAMRSREDGGISHSTARPAATGG